MGLALLRTPAPMDLSKEGIFSPSGLTQICCRTYSHALQYLFKTFPCFTEHQLENKSLQLGPSVSAL